MPHKIAKSLAKIFNPFFFCSIKISGDRLNKGNNISMKNKSLFLLAGAAEYTDYISKSGKILPTSLLDRILNNLMMRLQ